MERCARIVAAVRDLNDTVSYETLSKMEQALSPLEDASQWYMGGTKEMRECVPGFLKAEKKIEAMVELSKFSKALSKPTPATSLPA